MKKRLFSILTALALCLTLLPGAALAADDTSISYTSADVNYVLGKAVENGTVSTERDKQLDMDQDGQFTSWDAKLMLDTMQDLQSLALDKDELTMPVWSKAQLNAIYTPSNSYDMRLIWDSSDETVATVENGVVTAVAPGETIITAMSKANPSIINECKITVTDTEPTISAKALQVNTKGAGSSEWAELEIQNGKLNVTPTTGSFTKTLGALCGGNTARYPNAGALLTTPNRETLLLQTSYTDNTAGVSGNNIQVQVDPNSFAVPALSKEISDRWYDAADLSDWLINGSYGGRLLVAADDAGISISSRKYFVTDGKEMARVTAPADFPALLGVAAKEGSRGTDVLYGVTGSGTLYQFTLTSTDDEGRSYKLSAAEKIGSVPTSEMIQSASLLYDTESGYLLVSASYATDLAAGENAGLFYLIDPATGCYYDLTPEDGAVFTSLYQQQWRVPDGVYLYVDETPITLTEGSSVKLPEAEAYFYSTDEKGLVTNSKLDDSEVKWGSNDLDTVTVDTITGTITGVAAGFGQIWASAKRGSSVAICNINVNVIKDTGLAGATVGALVDTESGTVWAEINLGLDDSGNLTFKENKKTDKDYTAGGYARGTLWGAKGKELYSFDSSFIPSATPVYTVNGTIADLTGAPETTVTYTKDGNTQTVTDPAPLVYVDSDGWIGLSDGKINANMGTSSITYDQGYKLSAITYAGDLTAEQVRDKNGTYLLDKCDDDTLCHVYYALAEDEDTGSKKLRQLILVPQVGTDGTLTYTLCASTIGTVTGFPSGDYTSTTSMDLLKTVDKTYLLVARSSSFNGGSSLWKIDITNYIYADETLAATKIGSLDNTTQRVTALYHMGTDVIDPDRILDAAGWNTQLQPQSLTGAMLSASPAASAGQSGSEDAKPVTVKVTSSEPVTNGLWALEYDKSKLSDPKVDVRDDVLYCSYCHDPRTGSETGIVRIAFAIRGKEGGLTAGEDNPLFTVNFTPKTTDASKDNVKVTREEIYDITVTHSGNGTAAASPASALVGSSVKLTAAPDADYEFHGWKVTPSSVTIQSDDTFTMPGVPVTVEAVFVSTGTHEHTFDTAWTYDGDQHWHACTYSGCTEKTDLAAHSFQWIIDKAATTVETGLKHEECTVCHATRSEGTVIDKLSSGGGGGGSSTPTYPVSAPGKTENGSVSVSPKNASKGTTVTITVTPDSGYTLETIAVIDKNGNDLKLTDKGNGKYSFTMPGGKVEIKATFMEDNSVLNFFYDVPNDAYYYEAVKWAAEKGITGGVGNSLFAPDQPCTRAQIVTFLWRAAGSPVVNYLMPFTDVDEGAYYAEAVRWAASCGIVTGLTETVFGANGICTRAQAAAMLYRYVQAQGKGFTGAWMFLLPFTDVPEWAYEAVAWCYMNGVTTGVNETTFAPGNNCTRAQIVTFLWRAFGK